MQVVLQSWADTIKARQVNPFEIDLSQSTLIELLNAFQAYKRKHSPNYTINPVISLINRLNDRLKLSGVTLYPEHVDDVFYTEAANELNARGCLPSTISKYFATIVAALTWGAKHRAHVSTTYTDYNQVKFKRQKEVLTADEVSHIYHFDLDHVQIRKDKRETLKRVRDMFVLSCNLFQRYSDMVRITEANFDHVRNTFTITQQKTGEEAKVDMNRMVIDPKMVRNILKRYNYNAPYSGAATHYDHYLKELLQIIGGEFKEQVETTYKVNGHMVNKKEQRMNRISSHTARRTAISLATKRGFTQEEVRRCSGHASLSAFQLYVFDYDI